MLYTVSNGYQGKDISASKKISEEQNKINNYSLESCIKSSSPYDQFYTIFQNEFDQTTSEVLHPNLLESRALKPPNLLKNLVKNYVIIFFLLMIIMIPIRMANSTYPSSVRSKLLQNKKKIENRNYYNCFLFLKKNILKELNIYPAEISIYKIEGKLNLNKIYNVSNLEYDVTLATISINNISPNLESECHLGYIITDHGIYNLSNPDLKNFLYNKPRVKILLRDMIKLINVSNISDGAVHDLLDSIVFQNKLKYMRRKPSDLSYSNDYLNRPKMSYLYVNNFIPYPTSHLYKYQLNVSWNSEELLRKVVKLGVYITSNSTLLDYTEDEQVHTLPSSVSLIKMVQKLLKLRHALSSIRTRSQKPVKTWLRTRLKRYSEPTELIKKSRASVPKISHKDSNLNPSSRAYPTLVSSTDNGGPGSFRSSSDDPSHTLSLRKDTITLICGAETTHTGPHSRAQLLRKTYLNFCEQFPLHTVLGRNEMEMLSGLTISNFKEKGEGKTYPKQNSHVLGKLRTTKFPEPKSTVLPAGQGKTEALTATFTFYRTIFYSRTHRSLPSFERCRTKLKAITKLDSQARKAFQTFRSILYRIDCGLGFSVKWTCNDCEKVYKIWLCSSIIPYHSNDSPIPIEPCYDFCHEVLQRCPYFLPQTEYGGEPTYLCQDSADDPPDAFSKRVLLRQPCYSYDAIVPKPLVVSAHNSMSSFSSYTYPDDLYRYKREISPLNQPKTRNVCRRQIYGSYYFSRY